MTRMDSQFKFQVVQVIWEKKMLDAGRGCAWSVEEREEEILYIPFGRNTRRFQSALNTILPHSGCKRNINCDYVR